MRLSKTQKELLRVMTMAVSKGIEEVKSTDVHALVCSRLKANIHPNNWRSSCKILEGHGLITRWKEEDGFDWYMKLTYDGGHKGVELIEQAKMGKGKENDK